MSEGVSEERVSSQLSSYQLININYKGFDYLDPWQRAGSGSQESSRPAGTEPTCKKMSSIQLK